MRVTITKRSSTKAERRFAELLKKHRIPFLHRKIIAGREVDFIVGHYAIEIDGHEQVVRKNHDIVEAGYIPLHISNRVLREDISAVEKNIIPKLLWLNRTL